MSGPSAKLSFTQTYAAGPRGVVAQPHRVGTVQESEDGKAYVFVQANGAITDAGYVVVIDENYQATEATNTTAVYGQKVGVAEVAIPDDAFGWVQINGTANIRVRASCAANVVITSTNTAGHLDDAAGAGTKTITGAVLTTANGGSAGTAEGVLTWPTVGATN